MPRPNAPAIGSQWGMVAVRHPFWDVRRAPSVRYASGMKNVLLLAVVSGVFAVGSGCASPTEADEATGDVPSEAAPVDSELTPQRQGLTGPCTVTTSCNATTCCTTTDCKYVTTVNCTSRVVKK